MYLALDCRIEKVKLERASSAGDMGIAGKKCMKCSSVCMYVLTLWAALKLFVSIDIT